jgi:hypothetical protein
MTLCPGDLVFQNLPFKVGPQNPKCLPIHTQEYMHEIRVLSWTKKEPDDTLARLYGSILRNSNNAAIVYRDYCRILNPKP